VDVVVPFAGPQPALDVALARMAVIRLRDGDTVLVADNRPGASDSTGDGVALVAAGERRSSYYARNRGAERGQAPWIVFLDADVEPHPAVLDAYFDPAPGERTAVLAGAVSDSRAEAGAPRYAALAGLMTQENTLGSGEFAYAKTANCAVRRAAFEQVGGFRDDIRSGGDADLCFRLRAAGWRLEHRPDARVEHHARQTIAGLLAQRAKHGAGAAWLERNHPGLHHPRYGPRRLAAWLLRGSAQALRARLRGDRDGALVAALDPLSALALEADRLVPNRARRR